MQNRDEDNDERTRGATHPGDDLESISTPTELVWGCDDRANRLRIAEAASARYGLPLHVVDGAAGDPTVEQPEQFITAVVGNHIRSEATDN